MKIKKVASKDKEQKERIKQQKLHRSINSMYFFTRIKFDEVKAGGFSAHNVLHRGKKGASIGHEESSGFDLEMKLSSRLGKEVLELFLYRLTHGKNIGRLLVRHAANFIASSEIQRRHY